MLLRIVLALLLASSPLAYADLSNLQCTQTGPSEYKLSYSMTGNTHRIQIFASTHADASIATQPLLTTTSSEVTVHAGKQGERVYFYLRPDYGEQREVSIRRLPLEGTPNFRDLGGYETTDGRFVRWGLLYRSGVLSYLTASDLQYLGQLGVHVVCDFRTAQENATAPEKWVQDASVNHISLPIGTDANGNTTSSLAQELASNPSPAQLRAWMTGIYGDFALKAAPEYSKVFVQLEEEHLPLLYHCTAGKDRTGVFSAFLLLTLGVPEETVLTDYSLTTRYLLDAQNSEANRKMMAGADPAMSRLTPEQRQILLAADPEYLRSTLRMIDAKYGSFDNYRRAVLHISDDDVERLRSRLLTK